MIDFNKIKCFLLDLDGTVYLTGRLFSGAREQIEKMRERGRILFLTNNSSISRQDYHLKLLELGLNPSLEEIYTSANALQDYLIANNLSKKIFLLGTTSLKREFKERGFLLSQKNPDLLVASFDKQLNYKKLLTFCRFLDKGVRFFATHPDLVCPSTEGNMPDLGSFLSLFYSATKRKPDLIFGKPNKEYAEIIKKKLNLESEEIVMIGDRLSTDIQFAVNNSFKSVLVLSGETKRENLKNYNGKIDLVVEDISKIPL